MAAQRRTSHSTSQSMVFHTVRMLQRGSHDPTTIIDGTNLWRATYTPHGAATIHIHDFTSPDTKIQCFGPGASWLRDRSQDLLGARDDIPTIDTPHSVVERASLRHRHFRFPRTDTPYHEIIPAILGQRVTAIEAFRQWRDLCLQFGAIAPGPHPHLRLPPDPEKLSQQPYFALHSFGIERRRAQTIVRASSQAHHFFDTSKWQLSHPSTATALLTTYDGVGIWTAATAGSVAFGDPDALLVGDFHVKNNVVFALTGRPRGTDAEMIELLAPYSGHRGRVTKWLELDGWSAPKFGPRQRLQSIVHR